MRHHVFSCNPPPAWCGFLKNSWFTLRADKMLVNGGLDRTLADGVRWERENSPGRGPDMEERLAAFSKGK